MTKIYLTISLSTHNGDDTPQNSWIEFWFVNVVPKYLNCSTLSKQLLSVFISCLRPAFWSRDMTMYLVLSAFTSRPVSLLAITKASVFFFMVCTLLPNILTSLAWFTIIWTRKLTYIFLISVQMEAHSSSWRLIRKLRTTIYPSDFYEFILSFLFLHKDGLLSTSHINFSTSSTIDIDVWRKT